MAITTERLEPRRFFSSTPAIPYAGFRLGDGSDGVAIANDQNDAPVLLLERTTGPDIGVSARFDLNTVSPSFGNEFRLTKDTPRLMVSLGYHFAEGTGDPTSDGVVLIDSSVDGPGTLRVDYLNSDDRTLEEQQVMRSSRLNADFLTARTLNFNGKGKPDLLLIYGPKPGSEDQLPTSGDHAWILLNNGSDVFTNSITLPLPDDFTGAVTAAAIPGAIGDSIVVGESDGKIDIISDTSSGKTSSRQFTVDPDGRPIISLQAGDLSRASSQELFYDDIYAVTGTGEDSNNHLTGSILRELDSDSQGNLTVGPTFTEPHKVIIQGMCTFGAFGSEFLPGLAYTGISTSSHVLQDTSLLTLSGHEFQSQEIWYGGDKDEALGAYTNTNEAVIFQYALTQGPGSTAGASASLYELGDPNDLTYFPLATASNSQKLAGNLPAFPSDASNSVSEFYVPGDDTLAFATDLNGDTSIPLMYRTSDKLILNVLDKAGNSLESYVLPADAMHSLNIPTDNQPAIIDFQTTDKTDVIVQVRYNY